MINNNYKIYQQKLKQNFSKIPIIFQDNNFLPTENIYMELAISDYSPTYQTKVDELSKNNFENLPMIIQERQIEKEIRKLSIQKLFRGSAKKASVVLGDPGSGKSTLLKTIAYRTAHEDKYYPKYVFFVELKKFKDIYVKNSSFYSSNNIILEYLQKIELNIDENIFDQIDSDEVYFLFDGWDEVSGDKEIVDLLSDAIRRCSDIGNVILTSRRATDLSYFAGFDFYELLELSTRAIKNYILNFSKALDIDDTKGRTLVNRILNNEVLLRMARNPFLLSLICFLKSKEVLSDSVKYRIDTKIQLYDAVLKEMQKEYNKKQFGLEFDRESLDILSHFSFELFNYRDKTKHIFSNDDFKEFAIKEEYGKELLSDIFIKSKLLDSFSGNQEIYFIHLTFQEYLTAWQLSKLPYELSCRVVENVLEKSSWKQVLRFYAGILHSHLKSKDSEQKFRYLLEYAWKQRDELGLVEVEIGYWFADAGMVIPTDKPYDGLRENLWKRFDSGMMCAEYIVQPLLQYWNNESETSELVNEICSSEFKPELLKKVSFICSSSNIYYQKKMLDFILDKNTNKYFVQPISISLGNQNRIDLIESYCNRLEQFDDEQVLKIVYIISKTQDSEYYKYLVPLLNSENKKIVDKAFVALISIQSEKFFNQIEIFIDRYIKNGEYSKITILRYLEDELAVNILDKLAHDKTLDFKVRVLAMELISDDVDKLLLTYLDKDRYMDLFNSENDIGLKKYAIIIYSKILSLIPTEVLRKEFSLIQKKEKELLNFIANKNENIDIRIEIIRAFKMNRLRGITIFELFIYLEHLVFDEEEDFEIRNGILEVLCEQSIYFEDISMVKGIFQRGIKEFENEMLINTLFFIGQYGYKDFIDEVQSYAKKSTNIHIQVMAIQALGDLKDTQSIQFIYQTILSDDGDEYLKEICVEALIKLEPRLLLKHKDMKIGGEDIVYRELCRYVVENNIILRRDEFLEEQYG